LTKENVEPNPGPKYWDDFMSEVKKKWPSYFENFNAALSKLQNDLLSKLPSKPLAVSTKLVLEYLQHPNNRTVISDLQLTDYLQDLIDILLALEGNFD
jgi:hypothetical protein